MKNCAFTICTRSYIGLAKVLKKSFLDFHSDFAFKILVVDYSVEISDVDIYDIRKFLNFSDTVYKNLAFKYNVTEFCTALKPYCFSELFKQFENFVFYLDPDILVFSRFEEVLKSKKSIYLTPHRIFINEDIDIFSEKNILMSGLYNCGFVGVRKSVISIEIINWWLKRLQNYCFFDPHRGFFTDQKWVDFFPSLIEQDDFYIIRNPGYNFAPWNYHERKCVMYGKEFYVCNRKGEGNYNELRFVHYSGYDYNKMIMGVYDHKTNESNFQKDIELLLNRYSSALKEGEVNKYFKYKYTYNVFENGEGIFELHRRLFALYKKEFFDNPFSVDKESFYTLLNKKHLLSKNKEGVKSITIYNMKGISRKVFLFEIIFKFLLRIFGIKKYEAMLKMFDFFSDKERQLFLLD